MNTTGRCGTCGQPEPDPDQYRAVPPEGTCIEPGWWEIRDCDVKQRTNHNGDKFWWILQAGEVVGLATTLEEARRRIADLPHEPVKTTNEGVS